MEIINHLLGTCGESHPNLITVSVLVLAVTYLVGNKLFRNEKN